MATWEKKIQVKITANTDVGRFNDAIYFDEAAFDALSSNEIDVMANARVDAWVAFVEAQSSQPPYVPTKDDLTEAAKSQAEQLNSLVSSYIASEPVKKDLQAVSATLSALLAEVQKNIDAVDLAANTGQVEP